jgi:ammonium transporter, Amt family
MLARFKMGGLVTLAMLLLGTVPVFAQEATAAVEAAPTPPPMDSGNIAWMLTSSALVLMMTAPGLALFYGGLVRKKNILSVFMQCLFLMGLMSVIWAVYGYSLAFGGTNPYIGNFDHVLLKGVLPSEPGVWPAQGTYGIPVALFMTFQGMFFIITPALICGAFAERMKFSTMCVFMVLWATFVYCPLAHWVWSDKGWLCEWNADSKYRAIDFAGGTVVHISSGISALICCLLLGKRLGFGQEPMPPHNLTYTAIGAAMLWMGWFGFNGGSALGSNTLAVNGIVSTHFAAAAGLLTWAGLEWLQRGKPSVLGACSGAVAGLVLITPGSGTVTAINAMVLAAVGTCVCYWACTTLKSRLKYDDSLDAFGVHGVGGITGALLTGVFATKFVTNADRPLGAVDGNWGQLIPQAVSVLAAAGIAIVGTTVILKILDATMGLRVNQDDEVQGLDVTQHGEEGYIFY